MPKVRVSSVLLLALATCCAQVAPADGDRLRLEEAGPAVVKQFIATLRQRFVAQSAGELRRFIDPRYLAELGLLEGPFPIQTVLTFNIYDNQISDDPRTPVIVAQTEVAAKEAFVFRTTVLNGQIYLLPIAPPDPVTGSFAPWILRMRVES